MKQLLFFLVILSGCSNATTPIEKAKKTISKQLDETLHDRKSYESVKWGTLDCAYSEFYNNEVYKAYSEKSTQYLKETEDAQTKARIYSSYFSPNEHKYYSEKAGSLLDSTKLYLKRQTDFKAGVKSAFIGYKIEHSYRAKNLAGNLGIHHIEFYLNQEIDSVTDTEDVGKKEKGD